MSTAPWHDRRILFFGGKGGVGKTTLASAMAMAKARRGERVLVVSTDPAHNLGHLWDETVGSGQVPLTNGVWGTELDPAEIAREHVRAVSRTVRGLMPEHLHKRVDDYFALTLEAPGTHESALVDAMGRLALEGFEEYDTLVFDTAPTGHTTRLLEMPRLMQMWTDGLLASRDRADRFSDAIRGLDGDRRAPDAVDVRNSRIRHLLEERRTRFIQVQEILGDPVLTGFMVVTLPERLPTLESLALHEQLCALGMGVPAVLINRCSAPDAPQWRIDEEARNIEEITARVDAPVLQIPVLERPMTGLDAVTAMADALQAAMAGR